MPASRSSVTIRLRVTHDYKRHGTTTLSAALNVLDGTIIVPARPGRETFTLR